MKKVFISVILIICVTVVLFSQIPSEEYNISDGKNTFFLLMPISEVFKILGPPIETFNIEHPSPYKDFDVVTLKYSGITFVYFDFTNDPKVLIIGITESKYHVGERNLLGLNKNEILRLFGSPSFVEKRNEYFTYELNYSRSAHLELQIRFTVLGGCNEVILTHSGFFS